MILNQRKDSVSSNAALTKNIAGNAASKPTHFCRPSTSVYREHIATYSNARTGTVGAAIFFSSNDSEPAPHWHREKLNKAALGSRRNFQYDTQVVPVDKQAEKSERVTRTVDVPLQEAVR